MQLVVGLIQADYGEIVKIFCLCRVPKVLRLECIDRGVHFNSLKYPKNRSFRSNDSINETPKDLCMRHMEHLKCYKKCIKYFNVLSLHERTTYCVT